MPADRDELRELAHRLTWRGPNATSERFLNVFMDQNNKCNLRCKMCGFSDPRVAGLAAYDLPRWLFDRIAADVFPRANYLCLSLMTEPFMTSDFPDRLAAVRDAEVPFSEIITNGTLLTERACQKIIDARISRVIFSIDGGTKAVFENIRIGARFERVLANFAMLRAMRSVQRADLPQLRINHVLSELNIDHFDDFLSLIRRLRPEEIAVRTISRMSNALLQESTDAVFWSKVRAAREALRRFCAETGIRDSAYLRDRHTPIDLFTDSGDRLLCPKPWDTIAIHPNGDTYPCMAWSRPPLGNLATDSFDEIWNGAALASLRKEFENTQAGVDCLNCTIRRSSIDDPDDDFFYRKLAKPPVIAAPLAINGSTTNTDRAWQKAES
jgi:radical SAM protein with 4Fe4S-binding SPASM domain